MVNPLRELLQFGQSFWYDNIRREVLLSGELARMVREDGLRGLTSNPTIFSKAVGSGGEYDATIRAYIERPAEDVFIELELEDIAGAADVLRSVYDASSGKDGYVSIEVFPGLARDAAATLTQARMLWQRLGRPNVMVKVPATPECIPAIATLLEEGININITLMFGFGSYQAVVEAYLAALERRLAAGKPIDRLGSVASLFVSRVDTKVDALLEKAAAADPSRAEALRRLQGQAGIANARRMYAHFQQIVASPRWQKLAARGANPQRLLWASTSTKNPKYPDTLYAEALVGPETVDTMPDVTVAAYRDHGHPADRLSNASAEAGPVLAALKQAGVDLEAVLLELQNEGVDQFEASYRELIAGIDKKRASMRAASSTPVAVDDMVLQGPVGGIEAAQSAARELVPAVRGIWQHESGLWSSEARVQSTIQLRLGWLHVVETMTAAAPALAAFAAECREAGFRDAVLLGMGGSSLAPTVFSAIFAGASTAPGMRLHVLDTTDPDAIAHLEARLDLAQTLFLVSSKSGSTIEPNSLFAYFWQRLEAALPPGSTKPGNHFAAITDPGTSLEALAASHGFRRIFTNPADIGGRYSALSYFGLVPAALIGVDVAGLLRRAEAMAGACRGDSPANPGLALGAALGAWARRGRDKLTLLTSPELADAGLWLEQLIAESTGKHNTGIVPIAGESIGSPESYGDDRVFVYLGLAGRTEADASLALLAARHPVVRITPTDRLDLGQEFFRWEFATAVAGKVLGINPFDEPNVQESKDNTNRVLASFTQGGPGAAGFDAAPQAVESGLRLFVPGPARVAASGDPLDPLLRAWLDGFRAGDYAAILAYLEPTDPICAAVEQLRLRLRNSLHVATTVGFGPRFLHSTGQLHKGGPATGVFLQLTAPPTVDRAIPGRSYGFATLFQAQAIGDFQSLAGHGRRLLRVDLANGAETGLAELTRRLNTQLARMAGPAPALNGQRAAD